MGYFFMTDSPFQRKHLAPLLGGALLCAGLGFAAGRATAKGAKDCSSRYSEPDQPKRFAHNKALVQKAGSQPSSDPRTRAAQRMINVDTFFDEAAKQKLAGKRVVVTGAARGLGLAIAKELVACGAKCIATVRKPSDEIKGAGVHQIVEGVDICTWQGMEALVKGLGGTPVDVIIHNAGYFMREKETILGNSMDFKDELKTIDICAVGILRVTDALWQAKLVAAGAKIALITSQGGSIAWRDVQCADGGDYGHHMSKAAANMAGKLLANELKAKAHVAILHPGFNKTEMTSKYSHIWEVEGAVDASVGAKRVLLAISEMDQHPTGRFVNCEDGLEIPW